MISENTVSSDELTIEAPAEVVWSVLVDFPRYHEWNDFCPAIETELVLGAQVEMQVDLGHGPQAQVEYMSRIEPNRAIAWAMKNEPGDPVHAERTQTIEPLGPGRCRYLSIDVFSGPAVAPMLKAFGEVIERGFNRAAQGLKAEAELRQRGR